MAMARSAVNAYKSLVSSTFVLQRQTAAIADCARYSTDASRGVGPVKGPENDPATRGSTPDDSRADDMHIAEPKEITKQKVAEAQEEPTGLQGSKLMPGFDSPVNPNAKPQHTTVDKGSKYHTWSRQDRRDYSISADGHSRDC